MTVSSVLSLNKLEGIIISGDSNKETAKYTRINLYFSVFAVNLCFYCYGLCSVWTSPTIPILMAADSFLPINQFEASWIASLFIFGGIFGATFIRLVADYIGRKWSLFVSVVAILVAMVLLAFPSNAVDLYIARFITGWAGGIIMCVSPLYTAEISEDSLRGALNSLPLVSRSFGYVFVYGIGPFVSYHTLIATSSVAPVICVVLLPWIAESPYHLVAKGRVDKALETILWLRKGVAPNVAQKELDEIQESVRSAVEQRGSLRDLFATIGSVRAMYISAGLLAFQQLSGITVIMLYTESIFQMTGQSLSSSVSALLIGTVMLLASMLVPPLARRGGYVKPLVTSGAGSALFLGLLGLYFFLAEKGYNVKSFDWVPVTSLLLYTVCYTLGLGTMPWSVMGEVFPPNTKSLAAGLLAAMNFFLAFVTAILFPYMTSYIGASFTFWIYGIFCLILVPFTLFLLPETSGKSLEEIQAILNKPWKRKNTQKCSDSSTCC